MGKNRVPTMLRKAIRQQEAVIRRQEKRIEKRKAAKAKGKR